MCTDLKFIFSPAKCCLSQPPNIFSKSWRLYLCLSLSLSLPLYPCLSLPLSLSFSLCLILLLSLFFFCLPASMSQSISARLSICLSLLVCQSDCLALSVCLPPPPPPPPTSLPIHISTDVYDDKINTSGLVWCVNQARMCVSATVYMCVFV